jgi:hypothetical protein
MFKKANYSFLEYYGLFHFFDYKTADEKRVYTSLKQERFGLNPTDRSDVGYYHHLIKDFMVDMKKNCGACLESPTCKSLELRNYVTTDCTHVFCATCFKDKRMYYPLLISFC